MCRPPVTQLSPISNNRNGEFEAAHCRPQVTQLSPIGNNKNGEFETAHCRPPVTEVAQIANLQNGEFEAAHSRRPPVTQLSPIGNNKNGEFTVAFSHTANLKRVTPARRNLKRHIAAVSDDSLQPPLPRCALLKMLSVGCTRLCKRRSR